MLREMEIALSDYDELELVVKDADNDSELQRRQIRELAGMGVDVLIISPVQPGPVTGIASEIYESGIPVIITDRKIESESYTAFIGGGEKKNGREGGV